MEQIVLQKKTSAQKKRMQHGGEIISVGAVVFFKNYFINRLFCVQFFHGFKTVIKNSF